MSGRLLVVDDDPAMCSMLEAGLAKHGLAVTSCGTGAAALELLVTEDFDAVVTDLQMSGMSGLELCERIVASRPDVPVVVIAAFGSLDTAIAAIRAGAYDFIPKAFRTELLKIAVDRAIQHRALRAEVKRLRREADDTRGFGDLLGQSPAMRALYDLLDRVADADAAVLITGPSGTGKELAARAIHLRSSRRDGPFVAVNCAAVPETLLESELFGHMRGAFTDARANRTGLFLEAGSGTLLLDEIGELPMGLQPKLLRALQERKVRPVGKDVEVPFEARVIASTNRDLETAVEEGRFRQDLYYRINVIHVAMPPLGARGNDILLLAQHFLAGFARSASKAVTGLSPAAAEKLLAYPWPGNVRELQNCVERAVALTRFEELTVDDLPSRSRDHQRSRFEVDAGEPAELVTMEEVERRYIQRVLEAAGDHKKLAAQILGFDRSTLYRKLERYGLAGDGGRKPGE
jgi:two-component system, NtrC family, response regulator AtoC